MLVLCFLSLFSVSPRLSEKGEYILQFDSDFYKSANKDGNPRMPRTMCGWIHIHLEVARWWLVWLHRSPRQGVLEVQAMQVLPSMSSWPRARCLPYPEARDASIASMSTCKDGLGRVSILKE